MARNPIRRNQNLYCHYHQDQGHTTEDCRNLWDHLDQLVREGKLKQLLHHSSGQGSDVEIMYTDLYKGLNLRPEDLTSYNSPLVSFDGKIVIPKG